MPKATNKRVETQEIAPRDVVQKLEHAGVRTSSKSWAIHQTVHGNIEHGKGKTKACCAKDTWEESEVERAKCLLFAQDPVDLQHTNQQLEGVEREPCCSVPLKG